MFRLNLISCALQDFAAVSMLFGARKTYLFSLYGAVIQWTLSVFNTRLAHSLLTISSIYELLQVKLVSSSGVEIIACNAMSECHESQKSVAQLARIHRR